MSLTCSSCNQEDSHALLATGQLLPVIHSELLLLAPKQLDHKGPIMLRGFLQEEVRGRRYWARRQMRGDGG